MSTALVRPYRSSDKDDVYDVCIATSEAADGGFRDAEIVPTVFAGAYLEFEPGLAFVLDDGVRVTGYLVGTADTPAFAARVRAEWLPRFVERFLEPTVPASTEDWFASFLHHPEGMVHGYLADYPAHLHTNLMEAYRRRGYGRELMTRFFEALRARDTHGVHLSVLRGNEGATAFYRSLGFEILPEQPWEDSWQMGCVLD